MKQGQSTTQEVPAVRFCNGEKDPDGGKASPVEKCVAGWPEITITETPFSPLSAPAIHAKKDNKTPQDYQASLLYLGYGNKDKLMMYRIEDIEKESKLAARGKELGQVASTNKSSDPICLAGQRTEDPLPQYISGTSASDQTYNLQQVQVLLAIYQDPPPIPALNILVPDLPRALTASA